MSWPLPADYARPPALRHIFGQRRRRERPRQTTKTIAKLTVAHSLHPTKYPWVHQNWFKTFDHQA